MFEGEHHYGENGAVEPLPIFLDPKLSLGACYLPIIRQPGSSTQDGFVSTIYDIMCHNL